MQFTNYQAFKSEIKNCGLKCFEAESAKSNDTPFFAYFRDKENKICADGKVVIRITEIVVELSTSKEDSESEKFFEKWLDKMEINYEKTAREWDTKTKNYITIYEFELIFNE